jgi:predicted RNA-binding Zn ribbon-like protein
MLACGNLSRPMTGDERQAPPPQQPGDRLPAPGRLALVQDFLNSADLEADADEFADVKRLQRWARRWRLRAGSVTEEDRREILAFREALRDVLDARSLGPVPSAAVQALDAATTRAPLKVTVWPSGEATLEGSGNGAPAIVGAVLAAWVEADADGSGTRLKICRRDVCRWSFYDVSRNRSGVWCTMSICGNRTKAASFRRRRSRPTRRRRTARG